MVKISSFFYRLLLRLFLKIKYLAKIIINIYESEE